MIGVKCIKGSRIVIVEADGSWNRADLVRACRQIQRCVDKHGRICVLEVATGSEDRSRGLIWDHIAGQFSSGKASAVAVVADAQGIDVMSPIFTDSEERNIRHFGSDEYSAALTWLRQFDQSDSAKVSSLQRDSLWEAFRAYCSGPLQKSVSDTFLKRNRGLTNHGT